MTSSEELCGDRMVIRTGAPTRIGATAVGIRAVDGSPPTGFVTLALLDRDGEREAVVRLGETFVLDHTRWRLTAADLRLPDVRSPDEPEAPDRLRITIERVHGR